VALSFSFRLVVFQIKNLIFKEIYNILIVSITMGRFGRFCWIVSCNDKFKYSDAVLNENKKQQGKNNGGNH
jgi:hypothetical protein